MERYSVQQIMDMFMKRGIEVKKGTLDNYRSKLQQFNIINNNELLSDAHIKTFENIVNEKTNDNTWERLIMKYLYIDFRDNMQFKFQWCLKTIAQHLKWKIEHKKYKVYHMNLSEGEAPTEDFMTFCCCIDNFVEMGKFYEAYKGSRGTDGCCMNYKIITPDNSVYFIIGKLNSFTGHEDAHLFFSETLDFNIMRCKYIGGWDTENEDEIFVELEDACKKNAIDVKEVNGNKTEQ